MRLFIALILFVPALTAHAENVTCTFTEPFMDIVVDSAKNQVIITEAVMQEKWTHDIIESKDENGRTRVVWKGEKQNSTLEYWLDPKGGSDGMSDYLYPMSGETSLGGNHLFVGGCYTDSSRPVNPYDSPLQGCYEVIQGQYQDSASFYAAVGKKVITPLTRNPATKTLGAFLESAVVTRGFLALDFNVCRSLDEALK